MNGGVTFLRAQRGGARYLFSSSASPAVAAAATWHWHGGRIRLHKASGQHLLTNPRVLDAIVAHAAPRPGDAVLEIGPGTGNITARLLASPAASVRRADGRRRHRPRRQPRLAHKLTVTTGDAMAVEFPEFDICVASIPYGISSPLTAKLLFGSYRFRAATLLVQAQFARRLMGAPGHGEHNLLATNVRLVADVRLLMDVSRTDFVPMPIVDSSLVEIRPKQTRPKEFATGVDLDEWLAFTRVCTGQHNLQQHQPPPKKKKKKKRKTLGVIFKQEEMVMELLMLSQRAQGHAGGGSQDGVVVVAGNNEDDSDDVAVATGFSKEEVVAFKERIAGALQSAALADKTASQLPSDELLRLLRLFIHRGIRFRYSKTHDEHRQTTAITWCRGRLSTAECRQVHSSKHINKRKETNKVRKGRS